MNIGIALGKGFFCVDVDTKHDGLANWEEMVREKGGVPETLSWTTGSGGRHLIFKTNVVIRNRAGIRGGIDIRGEGGYIIAPPSRHASGNRYRDCNYLKPAIAPGWLVETSLEKRSKQSVPAPKKQSKQSVPAPKKQAPAAEAHVVSDKQIRIGTRNNTLFNIGINIAWTFPVLTLDDMWEILSIINIAHCEEPLDDKELYYIAKSIVKYVPPNEVKQKVTSGAENGRAADIAGEIAKKFHTLNPTVWGAITHIIAARYCKRQPDHDIAQTVAGIHNLSRAQTITETSAVIQFSVEDSRRHYREHPHLFYVWCLMHVTNNKEKLAQYLGVVPRRLDNILREGRLAGFWNEKLEPADIMTEPELYPVVFDPEVVNSYKIFKAFIYRLTIPDGKMSRQYIQELMGDTPPTQRALMRLAGIVSIQYYKKVSYEEAEQFHQEGKPTGIIITPGIPKEKWEWYIPSVHKYINVQSPLLPHARAIKTKREKFDSIYAKEKRGEIVLVPQEYLTRLVEIPGTRHDQENRIYRTRDEFEATSSYYNKIKLAGRVRDVFRAIHVCATPDKVWGLLTWKMLPPKRAHFFSTNNKVLRIRVVSPGSSQSTRRGKDTGYRKPDTGSRVAVTGSRVVDTGTRKTRIARKQKAVEETGTGPQRTAGRGVWVAEDEVGATPAGSDGSQMQMGNGVEQQARIVGTRGAKTGGEPTKPWWEVWAEEMREADVALREALEKQKREKEAWEQWSRKEVKMTRNVIPQQSWEVWADELMAGAAAKPQVHLEGVVKCVRLDGAIQKRGIVTREWIPAWSPDVQHPHIQTAPMWQPIEKQDEGTPPRGQPWKDVYQPRMVTDERVLRSYRWMKEAGVDKRIEQIRKAAAMGWDVSWLLCGMSSEELRKASEACLQEMQADERPAREPEVKQDGDMVWDANYGWVPKYMAGKIVPGCKTYTEGGGVPP